jgi:hypothetical protein
LIRVLVPYAIDDPVARALESPGVRVEAEPVSPGVVELAGWAALFPLVPYDQVTVEDGVVTGIHKLAPMWVFNVFCRTPELLGAPSMEDPTKRDIAVQALDDDEWAAAKLGADQVATELERMAPIYRDPYGVYVAAESRVWFDKWREGHPHVAFVEVMRRPDVTPTFEEMRRKLCVHEREII